MALKNVLFIGTGNAARSIMAEAYMNHAGRGLYRAFSAGSEPEGEVHPLALETLRDVGVRGRSLSSKSWQLFALTIAPQMDLVLTLCDDAIARGLPRWPGKPSWQHWAQDDPVTAIGLGTQKKSDFLECFAQLRQRIDALLLAEPPLGVLMEQAARGEVVAMDREFVIFD